MYFWSNTLKFLDINEQKLHWKENFNLNLFSHTGEYLNFSTWFMKNQFEQKKIEVWNERHFVETTCKTDIMQEVLKMQ